jgi:HEAT repeat protein
MLRELDDDGYRIFLAKALAGTSGPDALKAVSEMLIANQGLVVQKTLAVFLPDTLEAAKIITEAFSQETNARSRVMLLDEYARRSGAPQDDGSPSPIDVDSARAFFRKAVLEDADPVVRAEAVTLLGRRADPQDADLMATVAQKETQLQIRQAAIISLGSTGTQTSLPALQDLACNDGVMEVRATAVLAIAKVGADPAARDAALRILDQIAQNDSRDEVRSRALANANTLRLRTKAEAEERARASGGG